MKILILGDINSSHIIKWVTSLSNKGFFVYLYSNSAIDKLWFNELDNVKVYKQGKGKLFKYFPILGILKSYFHVKKILKELKPDILHAHYATSYGFLGALLNFHPFIISVWGSDVFLFPKKSFLHKKILQFNLNKADKILSTSQIMAREVELYVDKPIEITPFGIDIDLFKSSSSEKLNQELVIGSIKALDPIYGQDTLLKAFKIVLTKFPKNEIKLILVGEGSYRKHLENLSSSLGIKNNVTFFGKVEPSDIPAYHNKIDIFINISLSESFGVSVLEAMACEKAVVVSEIGGLKEIVQNGVNGLIVSPNNPQELAEVISNLIINKNLRIQLGKKGRDNVINYYNWEQSLKKMIKIYSEILQYRQ